MLEPALNTVGGYEKSLIYGHLALKMAA